MHILGGEVSQVGRYYGDIDGQCIVMIDILHPVDCDDAECHTQQDTWSVITTYDNIPPNMSVTPYFTTSDTSV